VPLVVELVVGETWQTLSGLYPSLRPVNPIALASTYEEEIVQLVVQVFRLLPKTWKSMGARDSSHALSVVKHLDLVRVESIVQFLQ
jgi:hypothetical protein